MNQLSLRFNEHFHRHKYWIGIQFPYEQKAVETCQALGCHWSPSLRSWLIENTPKNYRRLLEAFEGEYELEMNPLRQAYRERMAGRVRNRLFAEQIEGPASEYAQPFLDGMRRMMQIRRYAKSTINNYLNLLKSFFNYFAEEDPASLGPSHYAEFTREFIYRGGYSITYQRQLSASLRLFYGQYMEVSWDIEAIVIPGKVRKLPVVLSRDEVRAYLESAPNLKARCFLSLMYSCGMRLSEMLNMKWTDVDRELQVIWIRNAKGWKDRRVPLSKNLGQLLERYYRVYRTHTFIIEGQYGGRYSRSSVSHIIHSLTIKLKIKKRVTAHTFRHSFATHLMESGTSLRVIQELLGHRSSKTTEIYTHVSSRSLQNIRNPFDDLPSSDIDFGSTQKEPDTKPSGRHDFRDSRRTGFGDDLDALDDSVPRLDEPEGSSTYRYGE